ncbi:MAG TPA: hypothetical protein PLQ00_08685 [Thermoguttaceae bacterium]|nr:hypothetical protein [Thermoguttaceae bacterium]
MGDRGIDFRSDTVTRPTAAMRRAMAVLLIASGLSLTQHLWR